MLRTFSVTSPLPANSLLRTSAGSPRGSAPVTSSASTSCSAPPVTSSMWGWQRTVSWHNYRNTVTTRHTDGRLTHCWCRHFQLYRWPAFKVAGLQKNQHWSSRERRAFARLWILHLGTKKPYDLNRQLCPVSLWIPGTVWTRILSHTHPVLFFSSSLFCSFFHLAPTSLKLTPGSPDIWTGKSLSPHTPGRSLSLLFLLSYFLFIIYSFINYLFDFPLYFILCVIPSVFLSFSSSLLSLLFPISPFSTHVLHRHMQDPPLVLTSNQFQREQLQINYFILFC